MQCKIYRLYHHGKKLRIDAVRQAGPALGRLSYTVRLRDSTLRRSVFMAQLFQSTTNAYVIPVLDDASLVRIDQRGILLVGQEIVPRGVGSKSVCDYYAQSWLCKPESE